MKPVLVTLPTFPTVPHPQGLNHELFFKSQSVNCGWRVRPSEGRDHVGRGGGVVVVVKEDEAGVGRVGAGCPESWAAEEEGGMLSLPTQSPLT